MKLVCFSNNTGGGLICDLLNHKHTWSDSYKISNIEHNVFKQTDTPTISTKISDLDMWNKVSKKYKNSNQWYGTHVHPSAIPNLNDFEEVLIITTTSRNSKLYRWLRYYYGWFYSVEPNWIEDDNLEHTDKIREMAKNVFVEFSGWKDYPCVEFSDIVSGKFVNERNLNVERFNDWKSKNQFLFNSSINKWGTLRFNEAEYEIITGLAYKYHLSNL